MDTDDWREKLAPDSRQNIVNKILVTLKRHLPVSGPEGSQELKKIAARFEEKIYAHATSQTDYLRKISLKMLKMEQISQHTISNSTNGSEPSNPGASQVHSQGQSLPISMPANYSQAHPDLLSQNLQNNLAFNGFQQPALTTQQSLLATLLQPQQRVGQQANADNRQQNLIIEQQNNLGNMQHQQQRLLGQQNNLQYLQQQQGQPLMAQRNSLSSMLQQQWLRAQQVPMLQGSTNLLPYQGQQSQPLDTTLGNKMTLTGAQNSVVLQPPMVSVGVTQNLIPNASGQNSAMQNIASVPQNTVSNLMGQNVPPNMFANAWCQMPRRQQPESPNLQSLNLNKQVMYQKLQQGTLPHALANSHMQPQQQLQHQSLLQPNQLQPSQQSGFLMSSLMQPSMMQSAPLSGLPQNQPSSVQQSTQSVLQHEPSVLSQQPQQYLGNQFYLRTLLQHQQQQLMTQQNNLSNLHQQLLDSQSNFSGSQQKMLGAESGELSMKANEKSVHMMQQPNGPTQPKPQVPAQMPTHQKLQLHQLNEANVMKVGQGTGINNKKIPGLKTQAPMPAILAFMLFVLCLLYVWFLF